MAVGAHREEVGDRIHDVLTRQVGERTQVMDVDEPFDLRPVHQSKVESTDATTRSVMLDARPTRGRIPLVGVYQDAHDCTLSVFGTSVNLIRVGDLAGVKPPISMPLTLHHRARRRLLRLKRGTNPMLPLRAFGAFGTSLYAQHVVIAKLGEQTFYRSVNVMQMMLTVWHEVKLQSHEFRVQLGELGRNHVFLLGRTSDSLIGMHLEYLPGFTCQSQIWQRVEEVFDP
jgi:hypothetical protein